MSNLIYASPTYSLGDFSEAEVSKQAEKALASMRRSLRRWLKKRSIVDAYLAGGRPMARKGLPPRAMRATVYRDRYAVEQDLAIQLHALLVQMGCSAGDLPSPDLRQDPDGAVRLAEVALKNHSHSPTPTGIVWFTLAIPIGAAAIVSLYAIKTKADAAADMAEKQCIMAGQCTDYGFWLKVASVSVLAWLAWDKFGVREFADSTRKRAKR